MEQKNSWNSFEQTGKISDYLLYKGYENKALTTSEASDNADKNSGHSIETTEYR